LGYLPLNIVNIGAYDTLQQVQVQEQKQEQSSIEGDSVGADTGSSIIHIANPLVTVLYPLSLNKPERQGRNPDDMSKRKTYNKLDKNNNKVEDSDVVAADTVDTADAADTVDADEDENKPKKTKLPKKWLPFPTTLWMTCPILHAKICRLEESGWIQKLEKRLKSTIKFNAFDSLSSSTFDMSVGVDIVGSNTDNNNNNNNNNNNDNNNNTPNIKQMQDAHAAYQEYRWSLLSDVDKMYIQNNNWENELHRGVGVAGMRGPLYDGVKCLHAHYAHYLCRPQDKNLIGFWVQELLDQQEKEKEKEKEKENQHERPDIRVMYAQDDGGTATDAGSNVDESVFDKIMSIACGHVASTPKSSSLSTINAETITTTTTTLNLGTGNSQENGTDTNKDKSSSNCNIS